MQRKSAEINQNELRLLYAMKCNTEASIRMKSEFTDHKVTNQNNAATKDFLNVK